MLVGRRRPALYLLSILCPPAVLPGVLLACSRPLGAAPRSGLCSHGRRALPSQQFLTRSISYQVSFSPGQFLTRSASPGPSAPLLPHTGRCSLGHCPRPGLPGLGQQDWLHSRDSGPFQKEACEQCRGPGGWELQAALLLEAEASLWESRLPLPGHSATGLCSPLRPRMAPAAVTVLPATHT